jgi:hypothetical protein
MILFLFVALNLLGYGPLIGFQQIYGMNFMQSVIAVLFFIVGPYWVFRMLPRADAKALYVLHGTACLLIASIGIFVFPDAWSSRINLGNSLLSPSYVQFTMMATIAAPFISFLVAWIYLSYNAARLKENPASEIKPAAAPLSANNLEVGKQFGFDAARFKDAGN